MTPNSEVILPLRNAIRHGALALATLALAASASAAPITYSYYTATGSSDTSWVNVSGYDSIVAGNVGGSSTLFGSVNWLAMTAGNVETSANGVTVNYSAYGLAWATTGGGFYSGGPSLLNNGAYSTGLQASGVDYTINLSGLTVGTDYLIQFVLADNRDNPGHATILAKGANVTGDSARYRYSYTDGQFAVITASFTADAATAQFQPGQRWGNDVPNATFLSGIQVLAYDPPSNTAPVAGNQSVNTPEDTAKAITLTATDAELDPLTYSIVSPPAHGALTGTAPNITYTPAANYYGADSFTFKANDGTVDSANATVTITVTAVNDVPVFTVDPITLTATEDTAFSGQLAATDEDAGDTLTYSKVSGRSWLAVAANGALTGTPGTGDAGSNTFNVRVTDAAGLAADASLQIQVIATNPDANGNGILDA